jgi:hypothetical protein
MLPFAPPPIQVVQAPTKDGPTAKVVLSGSNQLALQIDGRNYPIQGPSPTPDGFVFRIERDEYTPIQQIYFWGITEWHDLEDENGKYYELAEYHIELDPKRPQATVEKPTFLSFWGHRTQRGNLVEFKIVKLYGMSRFRQPQTVRFQIVR